MHAILTTVDRIVISISILQNEKINTLSQVPKLQVTELGYEPCLSYYKDNVLLFFFLGVP